MFEFTAATRFKTNKPYLLKKAIITIAILSLFIYLVITRGIVELISLSLSLALLFVRKGNKNKNKDEGFVKGIITSYKNMFKKYVIDHVPVVVDVDNEKIELTLFKAELFGKKIINEKYLILKQDVKGVLCFNEDNSLIINFDKANINLESENSKYKRSVKQQKSSVMFYLSKEVFDELVLKFKSEEYCVISSSEEKQKLEELKSTFDEDLIDESQSSDNSIKQVAYSADN